MPWPVLLCFQKIYLGYRFQPRQVGWQPYSVLLPAEWSFLSDTFRVWLFSSIADKYHLKQYLQIFARRISALLAMSFSPKRFVNFLAQPPPFFELLMMSPPDAYLAASVIPPAVSASGCQSYWSVDLRCAYSTWSLQMRNRHRAVPGLQKNRTQA